MSFYVSETLPSGEQVVICDDTDPNVSYHITAAQWDEIARLPDSEQRHRLREFLIAARVDQSTARADAAEQERNQ